MNYLLIGNEIYGQNQRKKQLIEQYVSIDDQMNLTYYNEDANNDIRQLIIQCQTYPFLSDYRVIVYENPSFIFDSKLLDAKQQQVLVDYLANPVETTVLIIVINKTVNSNSLIYKKISKYFKIEKFDKLSQNDFEKLVRDDLKTNSVNISKDALDLLLSRLDNDVEKYKNELNKLLTYGSELDYQDIDYLINQPIENDIFKLTNAINQNDLAASLKVYRDLLTNNKNDVLSIIGLLASQYRSMSQVKLLSQLGYNNAQIAAKLNVSAGSVYYKLRDSLNLSAKELMKFCNSLAEIARRWRRPKAGRMCLLNIVRYALRLASEMNGSFFSRYHSSAY